MPTIYQIVIIALIAAFLVLFTVKTNIRYNLRDFCDYNRLHIIAKMLDCDFCFCFWTNLIIAIFFAVITQDFNWLYVPIYATPITRFLI